MNPVSQAAAQRRHQTVVAARNVLSSPGLRELLSERQRAALQARVEHPEATYAELAPTIGVNVSTCAYLVEKALTRTGGLPGGKKARRSHLTLARLVLSSPELRELLTDRQREALEARVARPHATTAELAASLGYRAQSTFQGSLRRGIAIAEMGAAERERLLIARSFGAANYDGLRTANAQRSSIGAQRQIDTATKILNTPARVALSSRELAALQARIANPEASLADLAQIVGCSKDTYSGLIRRALRKKPVEQQTAPSLVSTATEGAAA